MVLLLFFALSILEHHVCALALWQSFFSLLRNSLLSSSAIDISGAITTFVHSFMCISLGKTALSTSLMQAQAQFISFVSCSFNYPWDWLLEWRPSLNFRLSWIIVATNILTIAHLMIPHRLDNDFENTYQGSTVSHAQTSCLSWCFIQWASNSVSAFVESTRYKSQYL